MRISLDSLRTLVREVGIYGAASIAALGTDMGLLALLVSVGHIHYLTAATISFISGGVVLYVVSVKVVFRHRRVTHHALELSYFIALGVVGLIVNAGVVWFAVEWGHLHFLVGKTIAAGCTFGVNFILRRQFLFTPTTTSQRRVVHPGS